jgi:hypothetical protein
MSRRRRQSGQPAAGGGCGLSALLRKAESFLTKTALFGASLCETSLLLSVIILRSEHVSLVS